MNHVSPVIPILDNRPLFPRPADPSYLVNHGDDSRVIHTDAHARVRANTRCYLLLKVTLTRAIIVIALFRWIIAADLSASESPISLSLCLILRPRTG